MPVDTGIVKSCWVWSEVVEDIDSCLRERLKYCLPLKRPTDYQLYHMAYLVAAETPCYREHLFVQMHH